VTSWLQSVARLEAATPGSCARWKWAHAGDIPAVAASIPRAILLGLQEFDGGGDVAGVGHFQRAQDPGLLPPAARRMQPARHLGKAPRRAISLLKKEPEVKMGEQRWNQHQHGPQRSAGVNGGREMPPAAGAGHDENQKERGDPTGSRARKWISARNSADAEDRQTTQNKIVSSSMFALQRRLSQIRCPRRGNLLVSAHANVFRLSTAAPPSDGPRTEQRRALGP